MQSSRTKFHLLIISFSLLLSSPVLSQWNNAKHHDDLSDEVESMMIDDQPHVSTTHIKVDGAYVDGFSAKFIMKDSKRTIYYMIYEEKSESRIAYIYDETPGPITIDGSELQWQKIPKASDFRKKFGGFLGFNRNEIVHHAFVTAFDQLYVNVFRKEAGMSNEDLKTEIRTFLLGQARNKAHNGTVHYPGND